MFLKQSIKSSQFKQSIEYKKSFPSDLNKKFKMRKIDAAFISSIESRRGNFRALNAGIIAKKEIRSVLVKKGDFKADLHSATSNALAKVLDIKGEVIIGDIALNLYHQNPKLYIDLADEWYKKHKLPFVFARFCTVEHHDFYKRLITKFLKSKIKIPQYILFKYSKKSNVTCGDIRAYLKLVSYSIDTKSTKSLKLFLKDSK
jgi:chorismate dehydratase